MDEPHSDAAPSEDGPETIRSAVLRWLLTLITLVFWAYALFGPEGIRAQVDRYHKRQALQVRLEEERARTAALRDEVRRLREDDQAIEAAIRGELDYQRPGEKVLIVPEAPGNAPPP